MSMLPLSQDPYERGQASIRLTPRGGWLEMNAPLLPALPGYDNPELIAHGTTALVFRAIQTTLNRPVAIKVITVDTGSVPVNAARELATTVALSSQPHIVSIIDTGITEDDRPYIVMEYCEGGSYAGILRQNGPLPLEDVLEVGVKIGEALHAAHQVGIVHRDVKPSNILRSRFGPALTDFGIARAPDELGNTLTRELMTPHHASPEALLHQAQSGISDVYSLASTMWTLLIGHPPFVDPQRPTMDMYAFRDRVLHDDLPPLPRSDVPLWLVTELRKAMAKLPAARHRSAQDFAESLRRGSLGLHPSGAAAPLRVEPASPSPSSSPTSPASTRLIDAANAAGSLSLGLPSALGQPATFVPPPSSPVPLPYVPPAVGSAAVPPPPSPSVAPPPPRASASTPPSFAPPTFAPPSSAPPVSAPPVLGLTPADPSALAGPPTTAPASGVSRDRVASEPLSQGSGARTSEGSAGVDPASVASSGPSASAPATLDSSGGPSPTAPAVTAAGAWASAPTSVPNREVPEPRDAGGGTTGGSTGRSANPSRAPVIPPLPPGPPGGATPPVPTSAPPAPSNVAGPPITTPRPPNAPGRGQAPAGPGPLGPGPAGPGNTPGPGIAPGAPGTARPGTSGPGIGPAGPGIGPTPAGPRPGLPPPALVPGPLLVPSPGQPPVPAQSQNSPSSLTVGAPDLFEESWPPPAPGAPGSAGTATDEDGWLGSQPRPRPAPTRPDSRTVVAPPRSRSTLLAVLIAFVVVAIIGAGILLATARNHGGAIAGPPDPETASPQATKFITATKEDAPRNVKIIDERGTTLTVTWTDPTNGTVSFVVNGLGPNNEKLDAKFVDRGVTSVTFSGLSPSKNYCFLVAAVYSATHVAVADQTCTKR